MIYLTEGNIPLNAAYDDDIVQEANSTYQLTFKFPTNNILWQRLREETFLTADDLHGEQDFVIFEVEKKHGYIQVYANQVMTMLNHYVVNPISLNRETGQTALSHFAGSITRSNPFSFFSDIEDRHTFNIDSKNAMDALTKDKHSIVGLWSGDLVRHGYQVRLLKNGGSENESLFMYKKNLSSYEHKTSTKSLRTRITFITTIRGEGENPVDKHYKVVVDSPLISKYSQIYEDVVEVNDQDVKDEASLREYGKQYFRTTLCDMLEDSIEIDVIGQSDVPVQMFDVVGVFHEYYDLDVRKKITKYNYSPMAKKLKSIGFGDFKSGLASAIGNAVSDAVKEETHAFETRLNKEIENADLAFDRKVKDIKDELTDGIEQAKAKAEENKKALSDEIDRRFHDFSSEGFDEAKTKAEEALKKASASAELADEAKHIASENQITFTSMFDKVNRQENELSEYKQTVSERIANLSSRIANKADDVNFQRVRETAQLYERILGSSESDISRNASRLVMNDQKFQTEVGNYVINDNNLIVNSETLDKSTTSKLKEGVSIVNNNGVFTIDINGLTSAYWGGFTLPIYVPKILKGEVYTLGFKYRILRQLDHDFRVTIKNHGKNKSILQKTVEDANSPAPSDWKEFQGTFTMTEDFEFGTDAHYPLFFYLVKNGHVEVKEPMLVRGYKTGSFKPSQFDEAYRGIEATRTQITQKLAEYKETSDGRFAAISSQINSKVNQSDFQRVKETSQLYERILGTTEQGVADNASRLVMSSQIFQTEVKKLTESSYNLVFDPTNFSKWDKKQAEANIVEVQADTKLLRITNSGKNQPVYHGFKLPLTTSNFRQDEKLSYRMEAWVDVLPDAPLGIELWNNDSVIASDRVTFTKTGVQVITGTMTVNKTTTKSRGYPLEFWLLKNGTVAIGKVSLVRGETPPQEFKDDTSAQDLVTQTKVSQLFDSYAIQTLTSAGSIVSQINATNNQILIEAKKIRLKGKTLLDELTAIDGYFKRLFVGDATVGTLNVDIIRSNSISAEKLIFDTALAKKLVSSDVFTDTLAAKTAFINKLRSVVVSATLLEGYKGRIGGFQIGTHDKDPSTYWLTGTNQFAVGMSNGNTQWGQTALWVNWGDNWGKAGDYAWFVKRTGEMFCYNKAQFWNTPKIHGNLEVTGNIYYVKDNYIAGFWVHSDIYTHFQEKNGYFYMHKQGGGYSWIPINKEISDRRYKSNIQDSQVSGLDVIERLKTYSYRKEYDGKIEDISCGIMAQDVQKYAPEAFLENPDGAYSYNVFVLVPYLIKAIQELNHKVERLETT
nr:MAG TPA: Neck appendage protein [Caudoviricetes sp.]